MKIANVNELKNGVNEVFVGKCKFFVCKNGSAIKVYSSVCPHQGAILHCDCVNSDLYLSSQSEISKDKGVDCHESANADSRNDEVASHCEGAKRPKQSTKPKMDYHENPSGFSRNNKSVPCNDNKTQNLDSAEIYCKVHNWRFDCVSGEATNVKNAKLSEVGFEIDSVGDIYLDFENGEFYRHSNALAEESKNRNINLLDSSPRAQNDGVSVDSSLTVFAKNDKSKTRNDNAIHSSLRGSEATEAKQGEAEVSLVIQKIDYHDLATVESALDSAKNHPPPITKNHAISPSLSTPTPL